MCNIFAIYKYDPFSSCVKLDPVALGELQARGPEGGVNIIFQIPAELKSITGIRSTAGSSQAS